MPRTSFPLKPRDATFATSIRASLPLTMLSVEFNSVELLRATYIASERAIADFHSRRAALTLDSLVAAVFATAAVEAFTSELAERVEVWDAGDWTFNATTPELIRAVRQMFTADVSEQSEQPAEEVRSPGRAPARDRKLPDGELQDLKRLLTVRDAITHARAPRPGLPEVMAHLRRSDLTVPRNGASVNVFSELESPRLAVWAYCTARRVMIAMLDLVPLDVAAVSTLRDVLRDPVRFPSDRCRGK